MKRSSELEARREARAKFLQKCSRQNMAPPPTAAMALGLMGVVEAGTVLGGETVEVYHIPCS